MPVPYPTCSTNMSVPRHCIYSATAFLHDPHPSLPKTPQELLLQASIETAKRQLHREQGHAPDTASKDKNTLIAKWEVRVVALMA